MSGGALRASLVRKPWGSKQLPLPYGVQDEAIGEIRFEAPPPLKRILAKYLFTSDILSIQVHPTAKFCPARTGKDECWIVTEAEPTASIAVGFRKSFSAAQIRAAALDGTLPDLLDWRRVRQNDFIFLPAGTVHAIGAGVSLVELQPNVDTTFRLYDYGRGRTLHIEEAILSLAEPPEANCIRASLDPAEETVLLTSRHFIVAQCLGRPSEPIATKFASAVQILPLSGQCRIGADEIHPGGAGWATSLESIDFSDCERALLFAEA